ncbi:hypothetical protein Pmani_002862 [Petrolisthes manimaculis]|uniref:Uncharacterized protein n=1 Tax=Petrolisthes manimaculis TaxID=1843537 RepID=A0AAE1QH03_9EUCA|nr:hypothetical protein Pmani_002862 [Petrolisthes manimaculis]
MTVTEVATQPPHKRRRTDTPTPPPSSRGRVALEPLSVTRAWAVGVAGWCGVGDLHHPTYLTFTCVNSNIITIAISTRPRARTPKHASSKEAERVCVRVCGWVGWLNIGCGGVRGVLV